jgi:hypothetical protein
LRENWITQLQRAEKAQRILIDYSNEWAPTRWKTKNFEFLSCENNVEYESSQINKRGELQQQQDQPA